MKIKTLELTGIALNYVVCKLRGLIPYKDCMLSGVKHTGWWVSGVYSDDPNIWRPLESLNYHCNEKLTHTILLSEKIGVWPHNSRNSDNLWASASYDWLHLDLTIDAEFDAMMTSTMPIYAPDPLTAILRCYVFTNLGYEVDVPEELL